MQRREPRGSRRGASLRRRRPPPSRLVLTIPTDVLKWYGWQPWQLWSPVGWCGHRVEGIPVPDLDGRWRLIVVEGEAT
jgi:hypothetical protein